MGAKKRTLNIGRIDVKQSRATRFCDANGKSCRAAEKAMVKGSPQLPIHLHNILKNIGILSQPKLSLLSLFVQVHPRGRPLVSVTSDVTASASDQSAPLKAGLPHAW